MIPEFTRRAGEGILLGAAVVVPLRVLLNEIAGRDLHLTALAIATLLALAFVRRAAGGARSSLRFHWLDGLMVAFLAWSAIHLAFLGEPHPRAVKGFLIETRFAWIYLAVRGLGIGLGYTRRLTTVVLGMGIVVGAYGLLEYFFWWGSLPRFFELANDPRYVKERIPRLYSLVVTPVGAAYFLYGTLCAAATRWAEGERRLSSAAVVLSWIAIPLTLTRSAFGWSVALVVALALVRRDLRSFLALSVASSALSIGFFLLTGTSAGLARYAGGSGGALADPSGKIHQEAIHVGVDTMESRPLGFGFGHAGGIAYGSGGLTKVGETYYLILGAQIGAPAVLLVAAILAVSAIVALRAARTRDRDRRAAGLFSLTFLFAFTAGSFFLPIGSTAWMQLYLFSVIAVLVNEHASR